MISIAKTSRWLTGLLVIFASLPICAAKEKIARPVDSSKSFEQSIFQTDYDQVWDGLVKILSARGFQFQIKDKSLGQIETNYLIFSRHPQLSRLGDGVKSLAKTPRIFLKKWLDGRIKVYATVRSQEQRITEVVIKPDIYGFSSTLTDDSGVTGEWRQCSSNGKYEFELFNELATALREGGTVNPSEVSDATKIESGKSEGEGQTESPSNLVINSAPDAAEIMLDGDLVGMTPSRLTVAEGSHDLVLRKKGYREYQKKLVVLKNSDVSVNVELERE